VLDIGVQAGLVSNQTRAFAVDQLVDGTTRLRRYRRLRDPVAVDRIGNPLDRRAVPVNEASNPWRVADSCRM